MAGFPVQAEEGRRYPRWSGIIVALAVSLREDIVSKKKEAKKALKKLVVEKEAKKAKKKAAKRAVQGALLAAESLVAEEIAAVAVEEPAVEEPVAVAEPAEEPAPKEPLYTPVEGEPLKTVSIKMPVSLVEAADKACKVYGGEGVSRSEFIRIAIEKLVNA